MLHISDTITLLRVNLRDLIKAAKNRGCPYNPQADIEVTRGSNFPMSIY